MFSLIECLAYFCHCHRLHLIEAATQLAEALEVSLDFLVGATDTLLDTSVVNRILDIQKLKDNDKQHVFALLDALLKQTKMQAIM